MTRAALALAALHCLIIAGCDRAPEPAPAPKQVAAVDGDLRIPEPPPKPPPGGSPEPPEPLPEARTCQAALASVYDVDKLPGQVNGTLVKGADGLKRLRRRWGDALIVLRGGDFSGADLRASRLHNICFIETRLVGADLRGVRAPGVGFVSADLTRARLAQAVMPGVLFRTARLGHVSAEGASLRDGRFDGSTFTETEGLRFDRADMSAFRFECAPTEDSNCGGWGEVSFRRATLTGASLDTFFGNHDWSAARLDRTRVALAQLPDLRRASLAGPLIVRAGDASAALAPSEYRRLVGHIRRNDLDLPWQRAGEVGTKLAAAPGRFAFFVTPLLRFDGEPRASKLYRRLLPVLVAGAPAWVLVKPGRSGSIDAVGEAYGYNGHACGLSARRLRRDARTGWYSGPYTPGPGEPLEWKSIPLPVLRFKNLEAQVYEHGVLGWGGSALKRRHSDYVVCGARATFDRMVRVPIGAADARRRWGTGPQSQTP